MYGLCYGLHIAETHFLTVYESYACDGLGLTFYHITPIYAVNTEMGRSCDSGDPIKPQSQSVRSSISAMA